MVFNTFILQYSDSVTTYRIYHKYWDRQAMVKSVDPDQMLHHAASDQGLYCLPLIQ